MALVLLDRAKETTSTTGTGTLTLNGAVSGYQSFSGVGNGNTTYYTIESGTDWEVGVGTYTSSGTTLSRDAVLSSSAGGAKISVASGAFVWVDYSASKAVSTDNAVTLTNKIYTAVIETKTAIAASAIDLTAGNYFTKTISATTTFTVSGTPTTGSVGCFVLDITNGGSSAVTWWSGVTWASGTPPTLTTSGRDVLGFFTHDGGTTWNGFVLGKAMA